MHINRDKINYVLLWLMLFAFTVSMFVSGNSIIHVLLGVLSFSVYLYFAVKAPVYVLSLPFLSYYPFSQTFAYLKLPFLSAGIIMFIYFVSIAISLRQSQYKIKWDKLRWSIFPMLFLIILLYSWFLYTGKNAFRFVYMWIGFCMLPTFLALLTIKNVHDINKVFKFSYFLYSIFLISICIFLILNKSNYIYIISNEIDNTIGLSIFLLLGIGLSIMTSWDRLFNKFIAILSLFLIIYIFQRAFLLALVMVGVILFLKLKFKQKLIISLGVLILIFIVNGLVSELEIYKLNYLFDFLDYAPKLFLSKSIDFDMMKNFGTIGERIILWEKALALDSYETIFFGNGIGSFSQIANYDYPHNLFLEFFYSLGIIGILCSLVITIPLLKNVNIKLNTPYVVLWQFVILLIMFLVLQLTGSLLNIIPRFIFLFYFFLITKKISF